MKELLATNEFKPNCALVLLDFFLRHGAIDPDSGNYFLIKFFSVYNNLFLINFLKCADDTVALVYLDVHVFSYKKLLAFVNLHFNRLRFQKNFFFYLFTTDHSYIFKETHFI